MDSPAAKTAPHGVPHLGRALTTSILASAFGMPWVAVCLGMPFTMFLHALGASGVQIGLAMMVQQVSVIAQIPSSIYAERLHHRRHYWAVTALIHRVLWVTLALLPLWFAHGGDVAITILIAVVTASSLLGQASAPVWFSWMADLVPDRFSGRFWGIRQTVVMAFFVVSAWVTGRVLDAFPDSAADGGSFKAYIWLFAVATALGSIDILLHWTVPEPSPHRSDGALPFMARTRAVLADRNFRILTAAMGAWLFSLGLVGPFGVIFLRETFGASFAHLAMLAVSGSLGALCAGVPVGVAVDRLGARNVGTALIIAAPLLGGGAWLLATETPISFSLPFLGTVTSVTYVPVLVVGHFLGGALASGVGICQIQLVSRITQREGRTFAMALHWSITGLMAAAGPVLGGFLMDRLGSVLPAWQLPNGVALSAFHVMIICHVLAAVFLAAPLLHAVHRRGEGLCLTGVWSLLRFGNPMRTVFAFYNAQMSRLPRGDDPAE